MLLFLSYLFDASKVTGSATILGSLAWLLSFDYGVPGLKVCTSENCFLSSLHSFVSSSIECRRCGDLGISELCRDIIAGIVNRLGGRSSIRNLLSFLNAFFLNYITETKRYADLNQLRGFGVLGFWGFGR